MKILFIEIDTVRKWALASTGPASIASYIRLHGHEAALLRIRPEDSVEEIIRSIEKEAVDILGFSLTTRQWRRGAYVAGEIRKRLNIPAIAGGLHPTFAPESVLRTDGFDYVCLGDGEEAVCELLDCLEKSEEMSENRIANIWVKGASRPEIRPPTTPLDKIPFLARDLLDEQYGVVHLITQRGCPFHCTFCAAGAVRDLYKDDRYQRRRTVEDVVQELHSIKQESSVNYVVFVDDTFTANKAWVREFCRAYAKEISAGFSINARVETVTRDMINRLAEAGCRHMIYGVESGSIRIRRDIMNRPAENKRFVEVFDWTKQAGIMVTANYMIGLPGETVDDIEQTLELNEKLEPDDFAYFVFYPYPGTRLFHLCREKGFLPENWLELPANNRQSILNLPDLTKEDIEHYYHKFTEARERAYMNRYGDALSEEAKALARETFAENAAVG
ncbi:MAG: radical SAM protein [Deltaproteobacteria bacterium]|nr:MAG: radical SAM protein [Deltaproteobacteria bacterium]